MSWRKDARGVVRRYPQHKADLQALRAGSVTPNYAGTQVSHEASRTTEDVAMRTLPRDAQMEYDAVDFAIRTTRAQHPRDWQDRIRAIGLMYWSQHRRLYAEGVALEIPCSVDLVKRWNSEFLSLVDAYAMIMAARF